MKKQREFYQKLGMEVPGDIKGELCNLKTHLDSQRNGTSHLESQWKWDSVHFTCSCHKKIIIWIKKMNRIFAA